MNEYDRHCEDLDALSLTSSERSACEKLPRMVYAFLACNRKGERIVIAKRGDRACYVTTLDQASFTTEEAVAVVQAYNERLGVTEAEKRAVLHGSWFGFDTPGASVERQAQLVPSSIPTSPRTH